MIVKQALIFVIIGYYYLHECLNNSIHNIPIEIIFHKFKRCVQSPSSYPTGTFMFSEYYKLTLIITKPIQSSRNLCFEQNKCYKMVWCLRFTLFFLMGNY